MKKVTLCVHQRFCQICISQNEKKKTKKQFCKSCLQCFSSKNVLTEQKGVCLSINGEKGASICKIRKKNN